MTTHTTRHKVTNRISDSFSQQSDRLEISTTCFRQPDPFFGELTTPQSVHKYAYVHNDPVNGIDPSGEFLISLAIGFAIRGYLRTTSAATNIAIGTGIVIAAAIETAIYTTAIEYWLNGRKFRPGTKAAAAPNIKITEAELQVAARWGFPNRDGVVMRLGPPAGGVGQIPVGAPVFAAGTGENRKVPRAQLGVNEYVGPEGCGPCVGVLVVTPTDIIAVHLDPGHDSAARTLDAMGPYPQGTRLVITGATAPDDVQFSEFQLRAIEKYARRENITIDGFHDSSNVYADANGNYFDR